ncbi:MAG TPA: ABC transporter substrate-binding protein [Gemmatimonadales bacterium]|jgi:iron complex transport system substrate-binding protein|nr:ABC transporter substrate-binding protein [Gemmatimonadales bacterium]
MIRVVSLLPAGTEIVATLGAATSLVGISHECDYPAEVLGLPRVTATPIDSGWPSGKIDAAVRELGRLSRPVVMVNAEQIRRLAPDLVISQTLCEVCAVADGEVHRLVNVLSPAPRVVSLNAGDLAGIWNDIEAVGAELDLKDEAQELNLGLQYRLRRLARQSGNSPRPRVLTIEWLDPLFTAGHWIPELIHIAGGQDAASRPGEHSRRLTWAEAGRCRPDVIVVMLCGFGLERSLRELKRLTDDQLGWPGSVPVWVLDGNAYTSRAGPRVVDGADLMHLALRNIETEGIVRYR